MSDALGNLNDLKHDCRRHSLTAWDYPHLDLGDVERCECGRVWILDLGMLGRHWKPLRGFRKRRWQSSGPER